MKTLKIQMKRKKINLKKIKMYMNCKNNKSFLKNQLKVINLNQRRKLDEH